MTKFTQNFIAFKIFFKVIRCSGPKFVWMVIFVVVWTCQTLILLYLQWKPLISTNLISRKRLWPSYKFTESLCRYGTHRYSKMSFVSWIARHLWGVSWCFWVQWKIPVINSDDVRI
jgi:hypothetical protein